MTIAAHIAGQRFGRLVAIERDGSQDGRAVWRALCDCGNHHRAQARLLRSGQVRSCGCLVSDANTTHGMWGKRLRRVWDGMIQRCTNPNSDSFHLYGGRGICIAWESFEEFAEWALANGYADDLEIDREDVDGDYSPGNCRFVTRKQNARNRRVTYWVDFRGERIALAEMAERTGIHPCTLKYRMRIMGLSPEEAATMPITKCGNHQLRQ